MKITEMIVRNLVMLLDQHGLIHGAGDDPKQFCIQQAVNRVIHNDLYGQRSDNPGMGCLHGEIRSFGIRMNDCSRDLDQVQRALALKRFAIAELGSDAVDITQFYEKMKVILDLDRSSPDIVDYYMQTKDRALTQFDRLKKMSDAAADVLKELGTQGSKFLYLVDEPDKKKQIRETYKLGNEMYAAQMADFGTTSCAVKPKQHKH